MERVDGVEDGIAVDARVKVSLSGADADLERDEAACGDPDRGDVLPLHEAVEDHAGIRAALVGGQEVHDRVAADLLLAVAGDSYVHRQRIRRGELGRRAELRVQLTLVVDGAARVEPAVANGRLEGRRHPLVERRRRLHVEVAVDENRGRILGVRGGANLAYGERISSAAGYDVGASAGLPNEVAHPLASASHVVGVRGVGANARDAKEVLELLQPRLIKLRHAERVYFRCVSEVARKRERSAAGGRLCRPGGSLTRKTVGQTRRFAGSDHVTNHDPAPQVGGSWGNQGFPHAIYATCWRF